MRRHLFDFVAIVSLALCVSTAALWRVSYLLKWEAGGERIDTDRFGRTKYSLEVVRGKISVVCLRFKADANRQTSFVKYPGTSSANGVGQLWPQSGFYPAGMFWDSSSWNFRWENARAPYRGGRVHIAAPCWFVFIVTAVPPALWLYICNRRRQQLGLGRCRVCGYDLRATPDRCPECGAATLTTTI
jgi:hypothetical protein